MRDQRKGRHPEVAITLHDAPPDWRLSLLSLARAFEGSRSASGMFRAVTPAEVDVQDVSPAKATAQVLPFFAIIRAAAISLDASGGPGSPGLFQNPPLLGIRHDFP